MAFIKPQILPLDEVLPDRIEQGRRSSLLRQIKQIDQARGGGRRTIAVGTIRFDDIDAEVLLPPVTESPAAAIAESHRA